MRIDDNLGAFIVREARRVIESYLSGGEVKELDSESPVMLEMRGVFVTLETIKFGDPILRGCIGIPEPIYPLKQAIPIAAVGACNDPRFAPVDLKEMNGILVEVSVLTMPFQLTGDPRKFSEKIRIGNDGVIIRFRNREALMLPQVSIAEKWDAEDLLMNTCLKAGLPPDAWLTGANVYIFQADVFTEISPRGPVRRII